MVDLCKYSEVFGKPGCGAHSYRVFDIAIVDLGFTALGAYGIYRYHQKYHYVVYLVSLIIIGIVMHRIFCVKTTLNKIIFRE
jgi:hypothetical protein